MAMDNLLGQISSKLSKAGSDALSNVSNFERSYFRRHRCLFLTKEPSTSAPLPLPSCACCAMRRTAIFDCSWPAQPSSEALPEGAHPARQRINWASCTRWGTLGGVWWGDWATGHAASWLWILPPGGQGGASAFQQVLHQPAECIHV